MNTDKGIYMSRTAYFIVIFVPLKSIKKKNNLQLCVTNVPGLIKPTF